MRRQRGLLLLPVTLALAVIGTLAYTMTREGSMAVAGVDAQYDTDVARYLAEGGVHLAKWQNERLGCESAVGFGKLELAGIGSIDSGTITTDDKVLTISVTGQTLALPWRPLPAKSAIVERKLRVHDRADPREVTLTGSGGNDTTITRSVTGSQGSLKYLELTDDTSYALLKFSLGAEFDYATVLSARVTLTQFFSNSTQPQRAISAHRVTRDWPSGATWTSPWATEGGDYVAGAVASVALDPGTDTREYTFAIDGLVQGWANKTIDNHGVLLKPSGLVNARFRSLDEATGKPKLVVRYFPRC